MAELVLALDVPEAGAALSLLDQIPEIAWVKVGSVLFAGAGPALVSELRRRGKNVFLDLKWHDIPSTVAGAVRQARGLGVQMVTVHSLGGRDMMMAAKDAAGPALAVVGVTILTSHSPASFGTIVARETPDLTVEAKRLADLVRSAGLDGVVCSPLEASALRAAIGPGPLLVTPGIRSGADGNGDQSRTATARAAAKAGATHLVVGRPVIQAPEPGAAWRALEAQLVG